MVGAVAGVVGVRLPPGSVAASEVHCGYGCVVKLKLNAMVGVGPVDVVGEVADFQR